MYKLKEGWTKRKVMNRIKKYNNGKKCMAKEKGQVKLCAYENSKGNRCAVGCFIPDGHSGLQMNGVAYDLVDQFPDLEKLMPFKVEVLGFFQAVHDNCNETHDGNVYKAIEDFLDKEVE